MFCYLQMLAAEALAAALNGILAESTRAAVMFDKLRLEGGAGANSFKIPVLDHCLQEVAITWNDTLKVGLNNITPEFGALVGINTLRCCL